MLETSIQDRVVTVCICTYNRKSLLPRAVESVLAQTYTDFEIIIVDDHSSDGTEEVAHELVRKDKRIRYIRHEVNKGLAAARNTAIFNGIGKYFTFVDDDDRWGEQYLEEFVKVADQYDDQWCFCCGFVIEDILGQTVYGRYDGLEGKLFDYCKIGFTPPITSQFYFRETLVRCGGYNENVRSGVDHDLWLTLAFNGVYLKSVDKYLSSPSTPMDTGRSKMTNTYHKRIRGIRNSLAIWKSSIVAHYGEEYYQQFYEAYQFHEKKRFFKLNVMTFNLREAYRIYGEIKYQLPKKEIFKSFLIAFILLLNIPVKRTKYNINKPAFAPLLNITSHDRSLELSDQTKY